MQSEKSKMLKAKASPFPVFQNVVCELQSARFGAGNLEIKESSRGLIIIAGQLRQWSEGPIRLELLVTTTSEEVCRHTFGHADVTHVSSGCRVLCKESKFRTFVPIIPGVPCSMELPLERLHGVVELEPVFISTADGNAINGEQVAAGAIVGATRHPLIVTIDEDWTGDTIRVDWLDFAARQLPDEAFLHVELRGGSDTPVVWLNKKYRAQIEPALLRVGDNSPAAIVGSSMRQLIWMQVWGIVVLWAVKERSEEHENWPASRISTFWESRFRQNGWSLPNPDDLDASAMNETSLRIQHCLLAGQQLSHVNRVHRFQPEPL
jgi:hypothetical protein